MNQELMVILIRLTELIADVNRTTAFQAIQIGADLSDTDHVRWAVERLQDSIYELAREGV